MRRCLVLVGLAPLLLPTLGRAETAAEFRKQAVAAWEKGERDKAVELAGKAIDADGKDPQNYLLRGRMNEALRRFDEAAADLDKCLELDPKNAEGYDRRGDAQFKRGKVKEAAADYDRFLELRPEDKPGHWRRGIALYYAGRFDEGRKQFEGYEAVDTNDVENAVWHFLCSARLDGVEKARASILKIGKDRRVPMTQVYDLYRGKLKPDDVLEAAKAGEVPDRLRQKQLFYAHLYLGLYYEVSGDRKRALENLALAGDKYRIDHYMGDVARVHADLLRKEEKPK
jgi:lipoprotein NlpI